MLRPATKLLCIWVSANPRICLLQALATYGCERGVASVAAIRASFRANTAMFMHPGVTLAFLAAGLAGKEAGLQHTPKHSFIAAGAPAGHCASRDAYVGTIKIEPDALGKIFDHVFGQTGVSTSRAGLGAVIAFFDAAYQGVICPTFHIRMLADDFLGMHAGLPIVVMKGISAVNGVNAFPFQEPETQSLLGLKGMPRPRPYTPGQSKPACAARVRSLE